MPFGGIVSGGTKTLFDYEAKEFNSVLGEYDFHFRHYNPDLGIFTQPDSLIQNVYDPQSLNRYSFERNNPYKYTDKTGHNPAAVMAGIVAAYVAGAGVLGFGYGFVESSISQYISTGSVDTGFAAKQGGRKALVFSIGTLISGVATMIGAPLSPAESIEWVGAGDMLLQDIQEDDKQQPEEESNKFKLNIDNREYMNANIINAAYKQAFDKAKSKSRIYKSDFNPDDLSHAGEEGSNWGIHYKKTGEVEYFRTR